MLHSHFMPASAIFWNDLLVQACALVKNLERRNENEYELKVVACFLCRELCSRGQQTAHGSSRINRNRIIDGKNREVQVNEDAGGQAARRLESEQVLAHGQKTDKAD